MRNQYKRMSAPVSPIKKEIEEEYRFKSLFEKEGEGIG
jgi:hypothetical protein